MNIDELLASLREDHAACNERVDKLLIAARIQGIEEARETERKLLQTGPVGAQMCVQDGKPCYVGGDDPHWRCGTTACPNVGEATAEDWAEECRMMAEPLECEDCTLDGECTGRCDPDETLRFRRRAWL